MTEVLNDETVLEEPTPEALELAGSLQISTGCLEEAAFQMVDAATGEVLAELPEEDPKIAKLGQAALQIAMQMRQILETGEQVVMLLVKPDLAEKFERAFREQTPPNILPPEFVQRLPVSPDPDCEGVRIIVRADLIREFLLRYYGPPSEGGNGLIQVIEDAISRIPNCPIRVDLKALEIFFLLEQKERARPGIVVPTGASIRQGLPPNLRS